MHLAFLSSLPVLHLQAPSPNVQKRFSTTPSQRGLRSSAAPRASLQTTTEPAPPKPEAANLTSTSFGRGLQHPRRPVTLNELSRLKIRVPSLKDGTRTESTFTAILGFFAFTTLTLPLLTPNSEAPLASIIAVLLSVWAVDTLALNSRLSRLLSLRTTSPLRIATHEAGHLLVGYLLGVQAKAYTLPSAKSILEETQTGVSFATCTDAHRLAAIGMAGVAAETERYGKSEGGEEDLGEVSRALRMLGVKQKKDDVVRWGLLQATSLVRAHGDALDAVAAAMDRGESLEACISILEAAVDGKQLAVRSY